eukprot:GILK01005165.1.p1 GENE.GILK01005165.1~~GILK01005165.1.p1  ORF type:complete len:684 (-),score=74.88 GILK01005165.1:94-2145(-)
MDPVATLELVLGICTKIYNVCCAYTELSSTFSNISNDILILLSLLRKVDTATASDPALVPVIDQMKATLCDLHEELNKLGALNVKQRRKWFVKHTSWASQKKEVIESLTVRIRLVMELKKEEREQSRFHIASILSASEDVAFWARYFGSENLTVPLNVCLNALAAQAGRRLRHPEKAAISRLLDPDNSGNTDAFEFAEFLQFFGPIKLDAAIAAKLECEVHENGIERALHSVLDYSTGQFYEWFIQDMLDGQAKQALAQSQNRYTIRYSSRHNGAFVLSFVNGKQETISLYVTNDRKGAYTLSFPDKSSPTHTDSTREWNPLSELMETNSRFKDLSELGEAVRARILPNSGPISPRTPPSPKNARKSNEDVKEANKTREPWVGRFMKVIIAPRHEFRGPKILTKRLVGVQLSHYLPDRYQLQNQTQLLGADRYLPLDDFLVRLQRLLNNFQIIAPTDVKGFASSADSESYDVWLLAAYLLDNEYNTSSTPVRLECIDCANWMTGEDEKTELEALTEAPGTMSDELNDESDWVELFREAVDNPVARTFGQEVLQDKPMDTELWSIIPSPFRRVNEDRVFSTQRYLPLDLFHLRLSRLLHVDVQKIPLQDIKAFQSEAGYDVWLLAAYLHDRVCVGFEGVIPVIFDWAKWEDEKGEGRDIPSRANSTTSLTSLTSEPLHTGEESN